MMKKMIIAAVLGYSSWALAGEARWQVRVGALYRSGMEMKASGETYAGEAERLGAVADALTPGRAWTVLSGSTPQQAVIPAPTDALGMADREFDDGYNRISPPTPVTPNHETWYWGYDSRAAQYDAGADEMVFHRTTAGQASGAYEHYNLRDRSTLAATGQSETSSDETFGAAGLFAEIAYQLASCDRMRVDIVGGVSVSYSTDQEASYGRTTTLQENRYLDRTDLESGYGWTLERTFVETYRYDGNGAVPGTETHAGTYDGPGPVIPNTPISHTVSSSDTLATTPQGGSGTRLTASREWQAHSQVDISADLFRATLQVGPEGSWMLNKRINLVIAPKLALNLLDMSAERKERLEVAGPDGSRLTVRSWREEKDSQTIVPGAQLSVGVGYALSPIWQLRLSVSREWVFEEPDMDIGPSQVSFDLDSFNVEASASRNF